MKISIVLCTYNGVKFLNELLASIERQTILPNEMILSDDASTDDTCDLLEKFKERQSFPVYIYKSTVNRGVNENYEFALNKCSGDIIFFADQDDVWLPQKVELMTQFIIQNKLNAAFSNAELINATGDRLQASLWEHEDIDYNYSQDNTLLLPRLLRSNVATGSTLAITKQGLQPALPFPDTGQVLYDEWIACILAAHPKYSIAPFDHMTMQYRTHSGQYTTRFQKTITPAFPYNRIAHIRPIEVRQQLFYFLSTRLSQLGASKIEVEESRSLWNLRLENCQRFSLTNKLKLSLQFVNGTYHRLIRHPVKSWIKDLITWPH